MKAKYTHVSELALSALMFAMASAAALSFCGCRTRAPYDGAAADVKPKHVVFVGWDGFAAWTLGDAEVPTLRRMMAEGAWTDCSRSILPSASACNWRSIFTCSASEQHGYIAWDSEKPAFRPLDTAEGETYPDIFQCLRRERPDAEIGIVYEWKGIAATMDTAACSFSRQLPGTNICAAVCEYIGEKRPDFLAVCYDAPDHPGHDTGWGSPEYYRRVTELDRDLGRILEALEKAGMMDDTVVVVSSDHGGREKRHGGATHEEMDRPVFIYGKGVCRGLKLSFGGTIYDTGATLAALLGITPPRAWIGRPCDEAFDR